MLDTVLRYGDDRPVIVKPHPRADNLLSVPELRERAAKDDRLIVTEANVHDILAASLLTISINSTVALEGFLHGKPTILFGRSDSHHLAKTVCRAEDFPSALRAGLETDVDFSRYLAWYFLRNRLRENSSNLQSAIWRILADAGFPRARFGGHPEQECD